MKEYVVIERFPVPTIVTDEEGNTKVFDRWCEAQEEADDCQLGQVVMLKEQVHPPEFILKMDWQLLKAQKRSLTTVAVSSRGQHLDDLLGIIAIIDAIQDYAVDVLDMDESNVFDFKKY